MAAEIPEVLRTQSVRGMSEVCFISSINQDDTLTGLLEFSYSIVY